MKKGVLGILIILTLALAPLSFVLAKVVTNTPTGLKAAGINLGAAAGPTGLVGDLSTATGTVVQGVLAVVGTIFFIMMVYAGILWTSARGNDDQVGKAKNIITAAIIGLVITLGAYAITIFVSNRLGGQ